MEDIIEKAIKEAREKGRGKIISRDDIYNAIFGAGLREVVEWIDSHSGLDTNVCDEWEARKKVWGIK